MSMPSKFKPFALSVLLFLPFLANEGYFEDWNWKSFIFGIILANFLYHCTKLLREAIGGRGRIG